MNIKDSSYDIFANIILKNWNSKTVIWTGIMILIFTFFNFLSLSTVLIIWGVGILIHTIIAKLMISMCFDNDGRELNENLLSMYSEDAKNLRTKEVNLALTTNLTYVLSIIYIALAVYVIYQIL